MSNDLAILVPSCDRYSDVWPVLFGSLNKYWAVNRCKVYLITNHLVPEIDGVQVINVGEDLSWSDNLLNALKIIKEKNVLLYIDDLILTDFVDNPKIEKLLEFFNNVDGNYLRLNPTPAGSGEDEVGTVDPGDVYRCSTVFSVWRKTVLLSLLRSGESAWDFEISGTQRSMGYDRWFASNSSVMVWVNLIVKGSVDPRAEKILKNQGISWVSARKRLGVFQLQRLRTKEALSSLLLLVPVAYRRRVRECFK